MNSHNKMHRNVATRVSTVLLGLESRWHYWTPENVRSVTRTPLSDNAAALLAKECNAVDPHGLDYKTLATVFSELKEANEI